MTTATTHSPEKTALVLASSEYGPEGKWQWYFFSEETDGIFNGFVKSPFCPEGEYGLILSKDLINIPWIHIGMNPSRIDIIPSMDLMFKIHDAITKK